jgi:UDP-N-acetylglucosamine 2-epimerase
MSGGYIVVMQHPVTTEYAQSRKHIEESLIAIGELGIPAFWFWPNVDAGSDGTSKGIRAFREYNSVSASNFHFFKNMESLDFLRLLVNSKCLVGNSSVGIRECSFLGVPVVNIGTRQSGRERGRNVFDTDYKKENIKEAVTAQIRHGRYVSDTIYGNGDAGKKIAEQLAHADLRIDKRLTY